MPQFAEELAVPGNLIQQFNLPATAQGNYDAVVAMGVPFVDQLHDLKDDTRKVALIGGGPTLRQETSPGVTILDGLNANEDLIKVIAGSTHKIRERFKGVQYAVVALDNAMGPYYEDPSTEITYLVAAQAPTEIFKTLLDKGCKVFAYDANIPGVNESEPSIGVGSTAITAALGLFAGPLGRKEFEFFGVDGSTTYAFTDTPTSPGSTTLAGFEIADNFMPQVVDFGNFQQANPDITLHFNGDCAHAALYNAKPAVAPESAPGLDDIQPS